MNFWHLYLTAYLAPCCCRRSLISFLSLCSAGVSRISYWPGDAEISLLSSRYNQTDSSHQEAILDATAADRLKSNSRPHICVLLQPLDCTMQQFVDESSQKCDFLGKIAADNPTLDVKDIFRREWWNNLDEFLQKFFINDEELHKYVLNKMGLESFCAEPNFSNLRHHMKNLVRILASAAASVPVLEEDYGFFMRESLERGSPALPQDVVRHCIIQARLLACRTGEVCSIAFTYLLAWLTDIKMFSCYQKYKNQKKKCQSAEMNLVSLKMYNGWQKSEVWFS